MPSSGVVVSYGIFFFFFYKLHAIIVGYTDSHPHQEFMRITFSSHLLQHLLFEDFLKMVILTSVERIFHCSFDLHFYSN